MDPPPPAQTETKKKKKRMLQSTLNGRFFQKNKNTATKQKLNPKIFCDLDGVLVDFRRGVKDLTGYYPETHPNRSQMWQAIHQHESFYRDLNWTSDGAALWDALTPLRPNILTGVSHGRSVSLAKFEWCKRELNVEVGHCDMAAPKGQHKRVYHNNDNNSNNTKRKHPPVCTVITCWSKHKHLENRSGIDILIDDRPETLRDRWVGSGGTFVHHTSTDDTLRQLRVLGVFSNLNDTDNTDSQQKDDDKKESGTSETPFVKKQGSEGVLLSSSSVQPPDPSA